MKANAMAWRLVAACAVLVLWSDHALAASSLGIGVQEPILGPVGPYGAFLLLGHQHAGDLLSRDDVGAEQDAYQCVERAADDRPVLHLWHLPRRRAGPRQGGDLVLYGRQRDRAQEGRAAVLRLVHAAGPDRDPGGRCRVAGLERDQHTPDRCRAIHGKRQLRHGRPVRPLAPVAQGAELRPRLVLARPARRRPGPFPCPTLGRSQPRPCPWRGRSPPPRSRPSSR